eukprot:CAMPEP_0197642238 /NCGR_PEP_ID=MMETSP1338-20131121/15958_1 /TAXON_ID=43686 ORGANISM="Pelagodinium beii, Strain RCC1491" /NCGR_SAMPLE_ID=MMETSP1338 /ASSEMBLY_ACC=CAM_ASM_000754 /LENGTH=203 /DNA_ID=CAMNT_0043215333 /DNA_START=92 /DNA_END=703 /DNA_ORIENTATION=+
MAPLVCRVLILSSCTLLAAASRGEDDSSFAVEVEALSAPIVAPQKSGKASAAGFAEKLQAVQDWLFVSGPLPMVTAMSHKSQLRTLFIFGLAIFAMVSQIAMHLKTLKRGISKLTKLEEEAEERRASAVPVTPAAFSAAQNEEEAQRQRRMNDYRQMLLDQRRRTIIAAPVRQLEPGRRSHSVPRSSAKVSGAAVRAKSLDRS